MVNSQDSMIPIGLKWGENRNREPGQVHIEWYAPCGCAFHPEPFPHIHPCSNEHKRPDLHGPNAAATSMRSACVEKLRERANRYQVLANDSLPNDQTAARTAAAAAALNSAANELETLSIEQPKE